MHIGSRTPKGVPQILIPWVVIVMAVINANCELVKESLLFIEISLCLAQ